MTSGFAPELDDQVTEAVYNGGVLAEAGLAVDVPDRTNPLRDPVEVAQLALERREDREAGHTRGLVGLIKV
jgi:hypothetical protein